MTMYLHVTFWVFVSVSVFYIIYGLLSKIKRFMTLLIIQSTILHHESCA